MSGHTPGPWSVDSDREDDSAVAWIWSEASNRLVVQVIGGDNCEADARLIAAAPELLAACKALIACPDHDLGAWRISELYVAEALADAAILKAGAASHEQVHRPPTSRSGRPVMSRFIAAYVALCLGAGMIVAALFVSPLAAALIFGGAVLVVAGQLSTPGSVWRAPRR